MTQNAMLQTNNLFVDHFGTPSQNMVQCDRGIVTIGGHTSVKNQKMPAVLLGIMCHSPYPRQYDIKNKTSKTPHGFQISGTKKAIL